VYDGSGLASGAFASSFSFFFLKKRKYAEDQFVCDCSFLLWVAFCLFTVYVNHAFLSSVDTEIQGKHLPSRVDMEYQYGLKIFHHIVCYLPSLYFLLFILYKNSRQISLLTNATPIKCAYITWALIPV